MRRYATRASRRRGNHGLKSMASITCRYATGCLVPRRVVPLCGGPHRVAAGVVASRRSAAPPAEARPVGAPHGEPAPKQRRFSTVRKSLCAARRVLSAARVRENWFSGSPTMG